MFGTPLPSGMWQTAQTSPYTFAPGSWLAVAVVAVAGADAAVGAAAGTAAGASPV